MKFYNFRIYRLCLVWVEEKYSISTEFRSAALRRIKSELKKPKYRAREFRGRTEKSIVERNISPSQNNNKHTAELWDEEQLITTNSLEMNDGLSIFRFTPKKIISDIKDIRTIVIIENTLAGAEKIMEESIKLYRVYRREEWAIDKFPARNKQVVYIQTT